MSKNNSYEITGHIYKIFPTVTFPVKKEGAKPFSKREFILEVKEEGGDGFVYKDLVKFEGTRDWINQLDNIGTASLVNVSFSLGGREWTPPDSDTPKYLSYNRAWKVDVLENTNQDTALRHDATPQPSFGGKMDDDDLGLPF